MFNIQGIIFCSYTTQLCKVATINFFKRAFMSKLSSIGIVIHFDPDFNFPYKEDKNLFQNFVTVGPWMHFFLFSPFSRKKKSFWRNWSKNFGSKNGTDWEVRSSSFEMSCDFIQDEKERVDRKCCVDKREHAKRDVRKNVWKSTHAFL